MSKTYNQAVTYNQASADGNLCGVKYKTYENTYKIKLELQERRAVGK